MVALLLIDGGFYLSAGFLRDHSEGLEGMIRYLMPWSVVTVVHDLGIMRRFGADPLVIATMLFFRPTDELFGHVFSSKLKTLTTVVGRVLDGSR
jgi:hypothetical protein